MIELMIASSLMLLLTGLAVAAFSQYSRYVKRIGDRAALQQQSIQIMAFLTRDLTESNVLRIFCDPANDGVVFSQPRDIDDNLSTNPTTAELTWGRTVCYRMGVVNGENRILRQYDPIDPATDEPPDPATMTPPRNLAYFAASGQRTRLFAGTAAGLKVETYSPGPTAPPNRVLIDLILALDLHGRVLKLHNESVVTPRH